MQAHPTVRAASATSPVPPHAPSTVKPPKYTMPAVLLHWVLAVLIIGMIGLGWYMESLERGPVAGEFFNLHKSIGLVVAALVALRLAWRLGHPPAPLPASVPRWQARAAVASHRLLYAAMVAMPAFGITGALFSKGGLVFFGTRLPRLFAENREMAEIFYGAHVVTSWVLVALIVLHVLAALKHLLIDKDGVFQRMGW
jgi:cytochrome b561